MRKVGTLVFSWMTLIHFVGCQSDHLEGSQVGAETEHSQGNSTIDLPSMGAFTHCDPAASVTGGDLYSLADRIVIGEVDSVEFVEELKTLDLSGQPFQGKCNPEQFFWTLKVTLSSDEYLKGGGKETEVIFITPSDEQWSSVPMRRETERWLPDWSGRRPSLETGEIGWSGQGGIQEGQTLLLFIGDDANGKSRTVLPWASEGNGQFEFQDSFMQCEEYPATLRQPFSKADLTTVLAVPKTHGFSANRLQNLSSTTVDYSYCLGGEIEDFIDDTNDMN